MSQNINDANAAATGKIGGGQSKIEAATEIEHISELSIYYGFYLIGLIILIATYLGPFFYFKIFKKKSFSAQSNIGVKHAI